MKRCKKRRDALDENETTWQATNQSILFGEPDKKKVSRQSARDENSTITNTIDEQKKE
jgi:hypothetical protein